MSECCKVRYSATWAGAHMHNFICSENRGFPLLYPTNPIPYPSLYPRNCISASPPHTWLFVLSVLPKSHFLPGHLNKNILLF